ncbi:hypothetical protein E3C22_03945 [Jiella endophytica]|uniref:DUF3971 domain-containing protein n=1 Tax=Jiella endophytica TaxID=2558362 RepID=A0A4Y8RUY2_9HYPH|nr:hypothetical protein [Jiella endophytica]TFF27617.1 hypothetical protein E3C22_03945 [Jiella endophytica]
MRLFGKALTGAFAAVLVFVIGAVALLVATPFGNRLLLDQSQSLAASLLPSDVTISVQSRQIGFSPSGEITLTFHDVVLADAETRKHVAAAGDLVVGFSLWSALTGDISAEKITAKSLGIDTDRLFGTGPVPVPDVEAIYAGLDRAAGSVAAMPLKAVEISDVGPLGGVASAPRIARLSIEKSRSGAVDLLLEADAGGTTIRAEGTASIAEDAARLEALSLQTDAVMLPTPAKGDAPRPTLALALDLTGEGRDRRLSLAATTMLERPAGHTIDGKLTADINEGGKTADIAANFSDGNDASGDFAGELDLSAPEAGLPFRLASNRLVSRIASLAAGSPVEREALFTSNGVIDPGRGSIHVEDAQFSLPEGRLSAVADLGGFGPADRLTAKISGEAIDGNDLMAFWPFFLAEEPRAWALEHLKAGRFDTASLGLDLTVERLLEVVHPHTPMREDEFALDVTFSGGAFSTLDDMPDLSAASGKVRHRGDHVVIDLEKAAVEGSADVAVMPSNLDFQHAGDGMDAALSLNVEGPAAQIVELAERQPAMAEEAKDWRPEDVAGKVKIGVGVGFHLAGAPPGTSKPVVSGLNWSVIAELHDVDVKKPIDGRHFADLNGTAMIAEGSAMGEFSGRIDDIPATVNFTQPIGAEPVGDASLKIDARLDEAAIAHLSPPLARMLGGVITVELLRGKESFAATADLSNAAIRLPAIGWSKSAGVPGTMTFDVVADGGVTHVRNAVLKGEGFSATGSAVLDGAGLKSLVLNSLALNRDDSVSARLTRIDGGLGIRVAANSIDARPILAALQGSLAGSPDGEADGKGRLIVEISAEQLRGFGDEVLQNAEIRYEAAEDRVRAASLDATIRGATVTMAFRPGATDGPAMRLETADTGALLRFSGLYGKMRNGRLKLGLASRGDAFAGRVSLSNFTLVDEERLRSLVGTARQSSDSLAARLGKDLPVANAFFDIARANLRWQGGRLVVDDGIIRGPVFGSSFSGTLIDPSGQIDMAGSFMPAYGVNRLFGALPFVGPVLGNGGEGGLIGITYRLEGTLANPTLVVNPISLIAPGIFRRIFEY